MAYQVRSGLATFRTWTEERGFFMLKDLAVQNVSLPDEEPVATTTSLEAALAICQMLNGLSTEDAKEALNAIGQKAIGKFARANSAPNPPYNPHGRHSIAS